VISEPTTGLVLGLLPALCTVSLGEIRRLGPHNTLFCAFGGVPSAEAALTEVTTGLLALGILRKTAFLKTISLVF
jgi:hypothetical protein